MWPGGGGAGEAIRGRHHSVPREYVKILQAHFIPGETDSYHGHNNSAVLVAQDLDLIKSRACAKCTEKQPPLPKRRRLSGKK